MLHIHDGFVISSLTLHLLVDVSRIYKRRGIRYEQRVIVHHSHRPSGRLRWKLLLAVFWL